MEFPATAVLAGLILALLWMFNVRNRRNWRLPPGPTAFPLIGNLLQIDKTAPFKSFVKLSETYGPVMTVYLGWQRTVVLVGYDSVKEALVEQADDFTGRAPIPFLHNPNKNHGIGSSNGNRWNQLRRFTLTTLKDFGMGRKMMEEWIQEESKHMRAHMRTFKGTPFDPAFLLSCTVSNVICCLVFGQRFSYEDKQFLRLLAIFSHIGQTISSPVGQVKLRICELYHGVGTYDLRLSFSEEPQYPESYAMYNLFPRLMERLPGPHHKVFEEYEELREFIKVKIQEHKDTLDPSFPRDYIDSFLIRINQEKDIPTTEFNYDNLVSTIVTVFLGGTETTSSTLRYALNVLIKYPNIQEKMQQEIDGVIGKERCPSMQDRNSLPFSDAVIHEVQRFLDILPMSLPHYAMNDISFRGYTIPKDTVIIPLLHSVLKEEKQWATPWSFNPQHFLDNNGNFKKNPVFMPFSAGKRACVGESLARMELFIFLVSLLQDFTFSCAEGPDSINLIPELSSFNNVPRRYHIMATPR